MVIGRQLLHPDLVQFQKFVVLRFLSINNDVLYVLVPVLCKLDQFKLIFVYFSDIVVRIFISCYIFVGAHLNIRRVTNRFLFHRRGGALFICLFDFLQLLDALIQSVLKLGDLYSG